MMLKFIQLQHQGIQKSCIEYFYIFKIQLTQIELAAPTYRTFEGQIYLFETFFLQTNIFDFQMFFKSELQAQSVSVVS